MAQSLREIAETLKKSGNRVQLIYAFNGTGKTRLSREFKELIVPKDLDNVEDSKIKVIYYNAFTEDLFYWDNDLETDLDRKLIIQPNSFTEWILRDQGQDQNIVQVFQQFTNDKLTPRFSEDYSEVRFTFERGNDEDPRPIKISKGEESCFIWSVFNSLLIQIVEMLNVAEPAEREIDRYDDLGYVFIDDPVSSLDDTHLIELAVNIAAIIKSSKSDLKFIVTTHNPLFYNVLYNEFGRIKGCCKRRLIKLDDGTFLFPIQENDSPFSYHLFLLSEIERAIQDGTIQKFHFNFLRNILEKTATFFGLSNWEDLLPDEKAGSREAYYRRIMHFYSHGKQAAEEIADVTQPEKNMLGYLVKLIRSMYNPMLSGNSKPATTNVPA